MATESGTGVIISWNAVNSEIDGYEIITPDDDTFFLDSNKTSYTDSTPASTGEYKIYTVDVEERSEPATISSAPYVSTSYSTIYVWSSPEPSGFGWSKITGIGTIYDCNSKNKGVNDFFLDDSIGTFDFTTVDNPPYNGDKNTPILDMGVEDFFSPPQTWWPQSATAIAGHYYAMNVEGNYYAKVYVVSANSESATFKYWFQTIQNLRIF